MTESHEHENSIVAYHTKQHGQFPLVIGELRYELKRSGVDIQGKPLTRSTSADWCSFGLRGSGRP